MCKWLKQLYYITWLLKHITIRISDKNRSTITNWYVNDWLVIVITGMTIRPTRKVIKRAAGTSPVHRITTTIKWRQNLKTKYWKMQIWLVMYKTTNYRYNLPYYLWIETSYIHLRKLIPWLTYEFVLTIILHLWNTCLKN